MRWGVLFCLGFAACAPDRNMDAARGSREKSDTAPGAPGFARITPTVVFFGTSLTAGPGLEPEQAYPSLVEKLADSSGTPIRAINAGLSGETTAGALRRVDWVMRAPIQFVVIETGANDALRGLDPDSARSNIERVVAAVKNAEPPAKIILAQMEAPPNFGPDYTRRFHRIYPEVARREGLTLMPFLLDGVAGVGRLNQGDGVHPNAAGAKIVAANVWKTLQPMIAEFYRSVR